MYKILFLSSFNDEMKISTDDLLVDGLRSLGNEVVTLGYSHYPNTKDVIISIIEKFDIVFVGNIIHKLGNRFSEYIKTKKKDIKIILWYGDQRKSFDQNVLRFLKYTDIFFHTTGGRRLREYKNLSSVPIAAFIPNPCLDVNVKQKHYADVIFTGRKNLSTHIGSDEVRENTIEFLKSVNKSFSFRAIGFDERPVYGKEYFSLIKGSKIGIGISTFNYFDKYTSDRICHFISNGIFYLCKRFPNVEKMFNDKQHLVLWDTKEELLEKIEYYLSNSEERENIAKNGQKHVLENFNSRKISEYIMNVINSNEVNETWAEVY